MNMDAIGSAMLIIYDNLKDDKKSKKIIKDMDEASGDDVIKKNAKLAIKRLRELNKPAVADDLENKLKGFI